MQDHNVILIDQLRKQFGPVQALRGVSLTVKAGEIFGLLGSNGAGKTTLIRSLVGSLRPSGGSVTVLGLDPIRESRPLRRRIGYMPQAAALYEDLSPRDNLWFFATPHGLTDLARRIDEILEFADLRSRQRDPVHTFSGGMKQRVSLACALVHQPQVLLLDEPTAGVDPKLRETFWQHFRSLAAAGTTLLVSTHQMDEVLHCDRVAVMRDGVLLFCDTPKRLLERGRTTVKLWRGGQVECTSVESLPDQLPQLLQRHHLDPTIDRIELESDTLETIVLRLIEAGETTAQAGKGAADVVSR